MKRFLILCLTLTIILSMTSCFLIPDVATQDYALFTAPEGAAHTGTLVVVNSDTPYVAPADQSNLVSLWDNEADVNPYFNLNQTSMDKTALAAVSEMVTDFQKAADLHNVTIRVAYPNTEEEGYRPDDHLTGLGCLLKFVTEEPMEGEHEFETPMQILYHDLSEDDAYGWLYENCHKYGFVLRYPADKASVTGVSDYTDYFRYVGIPHATYMAENGLCLEEYVQLLTGHTASNPLTVTVGDVSYQIFYADISQSASVYYPAYHEMTWSGVGKNGVVLTLNK